MVMCRGQDEKNNVKERVGRVKTIDEKIIRGSSSMSN